MIENVDALAKPGDMIAGKYAVERCIGVGGMAAVFAAIDTVLDRKVAIKLMHPAKDARIQGLLNEARLVAALRSEHVVAVLDSGVTAEGAPYLVMEFLNGTDLRDHLSTKGRLPVHIATDYILQAIAALAEAHGQGLIHLDLKPENLFLTEATDGSALIKVVDFGISRYQLETSEKDPALRAGSPEYMSPEQLRDNAKVDARADIWAMGVVFYELLTGHPPFRGESIEAAKEHVQSDKPEGIQKQNTAVPAALEAVIFRCLNKDAEDRPRNVGELALALAPFGSEEASILARKAARTVRRYSQGSLPEIAEAPSSLPTAMVDETEPPPKTRSGKSWAWLAVVAVPLAAVGVWLFVFLRQPAPGASIQPIADTVTVEELASTNPTDEQKPLPAPEPGPAVSGFSEIVARPRARKAKTYKLPAGAAKPPLARPSGSQEKAAPASSSARVPFPSSSTVKTNQPRPPVSPSASVAPSGGALEAYPD